MNARLLLLALPLLVACSATPDSSKPVATPSASEPDAQAGAPGSDAGPESDGSTSPPANDPRCPPIWYPSCDTACSPIGLDCAYPGPAGGDALFCRALDAGPSVDASAFPAGSGVWVCGV